jgi:TetR/AcrR family transcriptional regulator
MFEMSNITEQNNKKMTDTRKTMILNAARALIIKYGIPKTTLDDIASSIGMKKSSLYYYYKNKEELIYDVINYQADNYYVAMTKKVDEVEGCINKIIKLVKINLGSFNDIFPILVDATSVFTAGKKAIFSKYMELMKRDSAYLAEIIKEGIKNGELKECDHSRLASSIITIVEAIKFRELHNSKEIMSKNINFKKAEDDIVFTISLLLDGLTISTE